MPSTKLMMPLILISAGEDSDEVTVVKLINSLFEDAIQVGASDIHIEPDSNVLRLRQRIDGVLHETLLNEVNIASALVLRLKLMANLDISEKRSTSRWSFQYSS